MLDLAQSQIDERLESLPAELSAAVFDPDLLSRVGELASKYNLSEDQSDDLFALFGQVIMGFFPSDIGSLRKEFSVEFGLSAETSSAISSEFHSLWQNLETQIMVFRSQLSQSSSSGYNFEPKNISPQSPVSTPPQNVVNLKNRPNSPSPVADNQPSPFSFIANPAPSSPPPASNIPFSSNSPFINRFSGKPSPLNTAYQQAPSPASPFGQKPVNQNPPAKSTASGLNTPPPATFIHKPNTPKPFTGLPLSSISSPQPLNPNPTPSPSLKTPPRTPSPFSSVLKPATNKDLSGRPLNSNSSIPPSKNPEPQVSSPPQSSDSNQPVRRDFLRPAPQPFIIHQESKAEPIIRTDPIPRSAIPQMQFIPAQNRLGEDYGLSSKKISARVEIGDSRKNLKKKEAAQIGRINPTKKTAINYSAISDMTPRDPFNFSKPPSPPVSKPETANQKSQNSPPTPLPVSVNFFNSSSFKKTPPSPLSDNKKPRGPKLIGNTIDLSSS